MKVLAYHNLGDLGLHSGNNQMQILVFLFFWCHHFIVFIAERALRNIIVVSLCKQIACVVVTCTRNATV